MKVDLDWGAVVRAFPVGCSLKVRGPENLRQLAAGQLGLLAGPLLSSLNMKKMKIPADVRRVSEAQ